MAAQPATRTPIARRLVLVVVGVALAAAVWRLLPPGPPAVTIGVEGRYRVDLPGSRLQAIPYTHGDALAVRIASVTESAGETRYDLRYMAYGPGEHDIGEYLIDDEGRRPADLPRMIVSVVALLAEDESGVLFDAIAAPVDLHSNYRYFMASLWVLWGLLLAPLILLGRRPREATIAVTPPPSVPERLRTLLETAEREPLSVERQADLETLLMAYWAERLGVASGRLVDVLARLREHPTAGPQVRSVELWLHGRHAPANGRVARELLNELDWSGDDVRGGVASR